MPQGCRWPSGESIDLAVLPITAEELATRIGSPLVRGVENGLGGWAGIGGRLPSGWDVEFICYDAMPRKLIVRVDKGASQSAALDEVLQLVGLSRAEVGVTPAANG